MKGLPKAPAKTLSITEFKAHCTEELRLVEESGERIAITRHGKTIAFASGPAEGEGSWLGLLDVESGKRTRLHESEGRVYGLSWCPDGKTIGICRVTKDSQLEVSLINPANGTQKTIYDGPVFVAGGSSYSHPAIRFSPNSRYLGVCLRSSSPTKTFIWDTESGNAVFEYQGMRAGALAFHPNQNTVVYSVGDDVLMLFDYEHNTLLKVFTTLLILNSVSLRRVLIMQKM